MAHIDIDHALHAVPATRLQNWLKLNKRFFALDQADRLTDDVRSGWLARGCLGALGCVYGGGDYDRYQNAAEFKLLARSTREISFIQALQDLNDSPFHLTANLAIQGECMLPTVSAVFVRVVRIRIGRWHRLTFVDLRNPVAASASGDTSKARISGKAILQLVPRA